MTFVTYPHPALSAKAEPAAIDASLLATGERLRQAAAEAKAYGLAGAHIGEVAPVIVLNVLPEAPEPTYRLYFNPRIVVTAEETEIGTEGSVSLPGVQVELARPVWAEIAYEDAAGGAQTEHFAGFVARCALHEIEQMNGRFFLFNLSRLKREMVLKKASKRRE